MRLRLGFIFSLFATVALAQSGKPVLQSGNITPNQVPWWITSGVIGGGVTSADSPITSFGVTNNGLQGLCVNSDRITAVGRNTMCFGVRTAGGPAQITVQNFGTAAPLGFQYVIDGTTITPAGGITNITVGSTTIGGGSSNCIVYDLAGVIACSAILPATTKIQPNIEWWGAIGDGNISHAAVNAAALTSALATGQCALIPNRTLTGGFNFGAELITVDDNQCIDAEADALVLYTGNSDFISMTSFNSRTSVSGLFIEMNGAGPSSNAIRFNTSSSVVYRARISDVTVQNAYSCMADDNANYIVDMIWSDIVCQKPKGTQMLFQHSRGFFDINNVNVDGSQQTTPVITYPLVVFQDYAGIQALDFNCSGQVAVIIANGGTPSFQSNAPCMKFTSTATQAFLDLNRTFTESSQGAGLVVLAAGAFQAKISLTDVTSQGNLGNQIDIENAAVSTWNNVIAVGAVGVTGAAASAHGIICISCTDIQGTVWRSYNNTGDGFLFTNSTGIVVSVAESGGNTLWGILENGTSNNNSINQLVYGINGSGNLSSVGAASQFIQAGQNGTVTSLTASSPITGGTITGSGTIGCPTCVTSAAALTNNALVVGGGLQASAALGSLGTTVTVLHGNAAGLPSFGAVGLTTDVTSTLPVANGGTGNTGTAWTIYVPTVTCGSGATNPTTYTPTGRYQIIGKQVAFSVALVITTNGACATNWLISLPPGTSGAANSPIAGEDFNALTTLNGGINATASTMFVVKYDGTYAGTSGHTYALGGVFESQ